MNRINFENKSGEQLAREKLFLFLKGIKTMKREDLEATLKIMPIIISHINGELAIRK